MKNSIRPVTANTEMISCLFTTYKESVKWFFFKSVGNIMLAEDMTQDLFLKLLLYPTAIHESSARGFVFSIARTMIIDCNRHLAAVNRATNDYHYQMDKIEKENQAMICKEIEDLELYKLNQLSPRMASVYRLSRFEDKKAKEIADELNISKRTIESHLFSARKEIRQFIHRQLAV